MAGRAAGGQIVSQYKIVLRLEEQALGRGAERARRGAQQARWQGARVAGPRQGAAGAQQVRGARVAWARSLATGCALGALGLFSIRFDLVLFLSQFLDIVREPGS